MGSKVFSDKFDVIILFAIALVMRAFYFWHHTTSLYFNRVILDSLWIHQWAEALAEGRASGTDAFFRAPLYPYFVAGIYRLGGSEPWLIAAAQHVMGAGSVALLYLLGRRCAGRLVGWLSGLMLAFYWLAVFFEGELLIVSSVLFLGLLVLNLLTAAAESSCAARRRWLTVLAGVTLGLASIARPNFLILAPLVVLWPLFGRETDSGGSAGRAGQLDTKRLPLTAARLREMLLVLLAVALPILPVTMRNIIVSGDPVLIASQGGLNLYIGNNAAADGKTAMAPGGAGPMSRDAFTHQFRDNITLAGRQVAEGALGRELTESEVSAFWFARTGRFVGESPRAALGLMLRKSYYFVNSFEISGNKDLAEVQDEGLLRSLFQVRLTWVLPLAWLGVAVAWRRKRYSQLLLWWWVLYAAGVIVFFVNARFRLPVSPVVFLFAAIGVAELIALVRRPHTALPGRRKIAVVTLLLLGLFFSTTRFFDIDARTALPAFRMNRAMLLMEHGDVDGAILAYDEALRLQPDLQEAAFARARVFERSGRLAEALNAYGDILTGDPRHQHALYASARVLVTQARLPEAAAMYQRCVDTTPSFSQPYFSYARLLGRLGRSSDALANYRAGLSVEPESIGGWLNYGVALGSTGELDSAIAAWQKVLTLDPGNEIARDNIARARQAQR
jgi:tetratricopeptide (TPR) repeat protein